MPATEQQNVPLLLDTDSEDDVERGPLPSYNQAQENVGFKLFTGNNGQPRDGKEPVALSEVHIRMGRRLYNLYNHSFVFRFSEKGFGNLEFPIFSHGDSLCWNLLDSSCSRIHSTSVSSSMLFKG